MKQGLAFGEHIKTEKIRHRNSDRQFSLRTRGFLLLCCLGVVVVLLLFKLISLQLFQGAYYRKLSDSNRTRTAVIPAPRGVIFDRKGTPLVLNVPGFAQMQSDPKNKEVKKSVHLSKEKALELLSKGASNIVVDSLREYPYKDAMAHVLGYLGQISADELSEKAFAGYQSSDWVGKAGVEQMYESRLRGKDGQELIEVDAWGKKIRGLGKTDPIPGEDITLTLDAKLQQAAYQAAKDIRRGVVIVSTPTGEILAMVSKPSYDPNLFTLDTSYTPSSTSAYRSISSILTDSDGQPLLNRAIGGVYPPASTFKLVTSAAGLENKLIDRNFTIADTGVLKVGDFSYANWYYTQYGKKEEGAMNVVRALARSNDIFYYKLAEMLDIPKLSSEAREFGLGKVLGIDLLGEAKGLVPTKDWKQEQIKEQWYLGDTFHYGIGQGYLLATPLQVNAMTQAVANGGTLYQPHLLQSSAANVLNKGFLSEQSRELIREGMIEACSKGGVAYPLFDLNVQNTKLSIDGKDFYTPEASAGAKKNSVGVSVACKTGTAQHGGEDTLPHAWVTLFAPAYHPEVIVTVLNESSGEGSVMAAPVARKVLEAYFGDK